ncbi:pantoate--beta-alanine ligase [uncultured Eudoraea sp.]|uniref:pantoate--beta-alanine ligase n=1 Tax=uncultured Eudoraea sp. TaxID=1035614 RepID=UPI002625B684|nr:pantoate--beta-alanine ligase [uncultured Eudoraea sp.]
MLLFRRKKDLIAHLAILKNTSTSVGLVPTMGALHEGHLAIVKKAISETKVVVVTIFVNPTQFDNQDDLNKYPDTLDSDLEALKTISEELIVFAPAVTELYSNNISSKEYDFDGLDTTMEGKFRSNHFLGVATVVEKLFSIVKPNKAYFGEKDFQQLLIIKKLIEITNMPIEIIGCPIVREPHGLAMSSRNERLPKDLRVKASFIYETLLAAKEIFGMKSATNVMNWVKNKFDKQAEFDLEYINITDQDTLNPVKRKQKNTKYRAFIAVYVNGVRLIDNIVLN